MSDEAKQESHDKRSSDKLASSEQESEVTTHGSDLELGAFGLDEPSRSVIPRDEAWTPSEGMVLDGTTTLELTVTYIGEASIGRKAYTYRPVVSKEYVESVNKRLSAAGQTGASVLHRPSYPTKGSLNVRSERKGLLSRLSRLGLSRY